MEWVPTPESSNIDGFGFVRERMVLVVHFKNGGRYEYFDVQERLFEEMKGAASKGQFLAQRIKGAHRYSRV